MSFYVNRSAYLLSNPVWKFFDKLRLHVFYEFVTSGQGMESDVELF
jgi:hypothetical protein